jgi:uncharacterized protein (DUF1697 family)
MTECIALLRGINVGRAKRVPMADLRTLLESLGCSRVRTLLNSGNAVFQAPGNSTRTLAVAIETAMLERFGFSAPVQVLMAQELNEIAAGNPLPQAEQDPSKFLVAFVPTQADLDKVKHLLAEAWSPDQIVIGTRAAYLWCATGILESQLLQTFGRCMGSSVTTRNWATVLKLQAAISSSKDSA